MSGIRDFLGTVLFDSKNGEIHITVGSIVVLIVAFFITWLVLRIIRKIVDRKLDEHDEAKFNVVFSFLKYIIFTLVFIITLDSVGVNVTTLLLGSTAIFVGLGLGLQQLFQDIIAGIFILLDKSVHVDDIIEIDGKVGRVFEIRLRTTRAETIDNKVLVIPNHKFLLESLYNWTQNGTLTREAVEVGVAYGSDVALVKKLLIQAANEHPIILDQPEPLVLFTGFGDSSLNFKLIFTLNNSFQAFLPKSDLHFKINELFNKHHIVIPFPQRDVHIFAQNESEEFKKA